MFANLKGKLLVQLLLELAFLELLNPFILCKQEKLISSQYFTDCPTTWHVNSSLVHWHLIPPQSPRKFYLFLDLFLDIWVTDLLMISGRFLPLDFEHVFYLFERQSSRERRRYNHWFTPHRPAITGPLQGKSQVLGTLSNSSTSVTGAQVL